MGYHRGDEGTTWRGGRCYGTAATAIGDELLIRRESGDACAFPTVPTTWTIGMQERSNSYQRGDLTHGQAWDQLPIAGLSDPVRDVANGSVGRSYDKVR